MKKTTLKSKIMAGVLCATLVGGAGTAFAGTDAAANLQQWYNGKLTPSLTAVWTDTNTYLNSLMGGLNNWFTTTKTTTVGNVATAGTNEIARANGAIGEAKQAYIDAINGKLTDIKNGMPAQYDAKVTQYNRNIDGYATTAYNYANGQITTALNTQGTNSVAAVNTEVGATRDQAIADLTVAINNAKTELEGLIAQEQLAATSEVKAYLDAKIVEKKAAIETATAALEAAKKQAITDKGTEIENAAKEALDALVAGI